MGACNHTRGVAAAIYDLHGAMAWTWHGVNEHSVSLVLGLSRQGFVGRGPRHKHSMMKCIVAVSMHRHPVGGVTSQHATRSRDNMIDIMYRMRT